MSDQSPGRFTDPRTARRRAEQRRRQVRRRRLFAALVIVLVLAGAALVGWRVAACACGSGTQTSSTSAVTPGQPAVETTYATPGAKPSASPTPDITKTDGVKSGTFLGNETRRFYGIGPAPRKLTILWKVLLGTGYSSGNNLPWTGSGWTGQPALVVDGGRPYLIASAYDYNLRKIDAITGKVIWKYKFNDIIKSSSSVFQNPHPTGKNDKYIVLAGSRRGYPSNFSDPTLAPYRALTWGTGTELWRLPVPVTPCYSRDCDGSGFYLNGHQYIGVESGYVYDLDPFVTSPWNGHRTPKVLHQAKLLGDSRAASHGGNLVLESSLAMLGDKLYIASGAGHVYGLKRSNLDIVWDYFIGSDMDGSVVVTKKGLLLATVEKQYIAGHGGVLCLDPTKPPNQATVWFFPTGDARVGEWLGGVLSTCAVNDSYNDGSLPALAAANALDGYVHVFSQDVMAKHKVPDPNLKGSYKTPIEIARFPNGASISTPLLFNDTLIYNGYDGRVHLCTIKYKEVAKGTPGALPSANGDGKYWKVTIRQTAISPPAGGFESTPLLWNGRVYVGSKDGWFYCYGDKS